MKKVKVECLEVQEKSQYNKSMTYIRILPVEWINFYYGNINNFIEQEKQYGGYKTYKKITTNDYDDKFNKYLNKENIKLLKCIEYIEKNNLNNKDDIVKYLKQQVI